MSGGVSVGDLVEGKYRVTRLIGEGGWGIVFEAENIRTLKRVALKVLRNQANVTADIRARFEREAQAAGRIGSEHIVEVFDLGATEDGASYMVMELLHGEDLGTRLRGETKLDAVRAAKYVVQVLDGLHAAHEAGILHRDLKPENLFLVPTKGGGDEFVKILDFGISKFSNAQLPTSNTVTGAVLGSPCYMAPEQARGLKQIDARTDLYAVGTVLFECVTGRVPFLGDNFNDLMFRIVLAPRPDPREIEPTLDPDMAAIILKAISTEPAERFASALEMKGALTTWLASQGVMSVRAPDVRKTVRTPNRTPGTTGDVRDSLKKVATTPEPRRDRPMWSDATMPVESGVLTDTGTPIASSRSIGLPDKSRRRRRTAVVLLGAVAAIAVGGFALRHVLHGAPPPVAGTGVVVSATGNVPTSAAATVAAEPAPPTMPATLELDGSPATTATTMPATAASAALAGSSAPAAASATHHARNGRNAGKDAGAPVAEVAKPADPAAPPPAAPPAATVKGNEKVEGREIRTNL